MTSIILSQEATTEKKPARFQKQVNSWRRE